jgi:radical SAM superfamily enzyme YgiQ (UPF0313 family)
MNALLLYPRFPVTFWSLGHALKFVGRRSVMPPLGLLTVAAMLPPDWNLRLVDTNVRDLNDDDLAWADIALISAMGVQRRSAKELIDRLKRASVTVVAGGPLFTAEPDAFPEVDHLVLNEAEITLPRFLADWQLGQPGRRYTTTDFADLSRSPIPRSDLLEMKHYFTMGVQYSRGCPFNCEFCNVTTLFGRKPRTKSADQVIAELDGLRAAGWRHGVFFVDDNLIGNKKTVRTELLPALIDYQAAHRGSGMPFNTQASINMADDPKMLELLSRAGFDTVFIGIETPDAESLAECGKVQNRKRNMIDDVKTIQRAGIQVQGGFIVGFDSDTASIFQRQIDFIQKSGIVTAMVGLLNALPGTALHDRLRRDGRLLKDSSGDNVDGTTNFLPHMDLTLLNEGYRRILKSIYSPANYYRRVRTFLREYRPPTIKSCRAKERHWAFVRSIYRLGIVGRERVQYWKLLVWTLARRPRLFSHAITLAITGHHFRRVCELHLATPQPVFAAGEAVAESTR